jgi:hypothetical protein
LLIYLQINKVINLVTSQKLVRKFLTVMWKYVAGTIVVGSVTYSL